MQHLKMNELAEALQLFEEMRLEGEQPTHAVYEMLIRGCTIAMTRPQPGRRARAAPRARTHTCAHARTHAHMHSCTHTNTALSPPASRCLTSGRPTT